ncbi:cytochrome c oxidase subunit 3 family protein [Thiothrix litoralis]|jgi:nitric oxide reductase NorE protein|uniref:Cytochrome c oxidase subunit 3 family protein n=1 Tax=Thiothrix litoralis TaxID=2891210 RepID=A0ABX7WS22_9GAMM|nr:cytochrome c oxidase subunit 3 family protein [Thiothrix litoralis]QTR46370.1 cytochrome c oxidase subunit 3 family protein [Thiothrix litoralis]
MNATTDLPVSSETRRLAPLPGDLAMWIFILAELLVFAVFFASYAFARSGNVELFNHYQQTLDRDIGAANTVILLTGSLFVVLAVQAIKAGKAALCRNWLLAGTGMGLLFLILKSIEFADKFGQGISLSTNTFYMFYLSLTFFHFMHVIMGMVILLAVAWKAHSGDYSATQHTGVETGASYWHMVDLVWVVLFPLVYVMR